MSVRNFSRSFREEVGQSPARWVERTRVDAARAAIEAGATSVAEIATAAGFASPHTLRQAFLRTTGVSPTQFRRTM